MKNNPLKFGRLFALILVLVHLSVWAQPLEAWFMPRSGTAQPVAFLQKTSDTLLPPFVDGFSHRLHPAWTSSGVIAGSQWSVDPLSLGAAVFDGIAADGQAYRPGVLGNDSLTDALVSPYFNLTGQSNGVLSFYLQQGGAGRSNGNPGLALGPLLESKHQCMGARLWASRRGKYGPVARSGNRAPCAPEWPKWGAIPG